MEIPVGRVCAIAWWVMGPRAFGASVDAAGPRNRLGVSRCLFASVCATVQVPSLPARLVAGLFILKHMHNLSDRCCAHAGRRTPYS